MKEDLTKKSGILYLSFFLLMVCAVSTAVMAPVALLTEKPIQKAKIQKTSDGLRLIIPEFNNNPMEEAREFDGVTIYPVRVNGELTGFAVQASTALGYGGDIEGLLGYNKDLSIRKFIITSHRETPGIGTKVTDRSRNRKISDILSGKPADKSLPDNKILDSFAGLKPEADMSGAVKWDHNQVEFITGATVSSKAVTDLAWKATEKLANHYQEFPYTLESGKDK